MTNGCPLGILPTIWLTDEVAPLALAEAICVHSTKLPEKENQRRAAHAQLAGIRIDWDGKPIADRAVLRDHARA